MERMHFIRKYIEDWKVYKNDSGRIKVKCKIKGKWNGLEELWRGEKNTLEEDLYLFLLRKAEYVESITFKEIEVKL